MSKILVTGGAGFIGSHTCLALLKKKYRIVVIDSFINSSPIALKRVKKILKINKDNDVIEIIRGDLRNFDEIDNIFSKSILDFQHLIWTHSDRSFFIILNLKIFIYIKFY